MSKENAVCLAGLSIPMLVGSIIYLTCGGTTVIYRWFTEMGVSLKTVDYPQFVRNYGCDLLWGYALYSGLRLVEDKTAPVSKSLLIAMVTLIFLEGIQLFDMVPGVFDPLDILVETIAVLSAMFITTTIGRNVYEKAG